MGAALSDSEHLFSYDIKGPKGDIKINIFQALTLLANYFNIKGLLPLNRIGYNQYFTQYARPICDQYVVYNNEVLNKFLSETQIPAIFSSGRYSQLGSSNSISQSCIDTMTMMVQLWSQTRGTIRRPYLNSVL